MDSEVKCTCKCINAFRIPPKTKNLPQGRLVGCKDGVHCGRDNKGCGFKRGDSW